ncbi:PBP1A family penicillin-binding protein [Antarcticirhabdus aurantiaca]
MPRRRSAVRLPGRLAAALKRARIPAGLGLRRRPWTGRRIAKTVVATALAVVALVGAFAYSILHDVPFDAILAGSSEPIVVLQAADGAALIQKGPYQGAYATRSEFPDHLVQTVLSIEDRRFFDHGGIDYRGIGRALARNVMAGEVVEGGSTITQQLLKILYLERERTFKRKAQELFLAYWLEGQLSKDEILTRYLNNVYLGAGATGMPAAAHVYFNKTVGELNVAESALLAGLIRAPSQLNPFENLDAAKERARVVLSAMGETGHLSEAEAAAAILASTRLDPAPAEGSGSWFADWVMTEAREIAGPFRGSIEVRTTLDPRLQALAEEIVARALQSKGDDLGASEAALVALRPDGSVAAMVGGRDYAASQFNRASQARRQPGSTFKLFVYYAALRAGMGPRDRVSDRRLEIDGWSPQNYGGRYRGRVSLAEAFARSLNAASVRLAMDVGLPAVVAAARDLGIDAELRETPSLALGTSEVTLLDLTGAYASVRAGVAPIEPWGIAAFKVESAGQTFRIGPAKRPDLDLRPHRDTLIGLLKLVVDKGTGREAALDGFAAGKTGTSQDSRDAWFVGFNETLTVGVWVGNDDGTPMKEVTGGALPAAIWREFMERATTTPDPAVGGVEVAAPTAPRKPEEQAPSVPTSIRELVEGPASDPAPQCNVRACARAYRSFRASDCTFQPYRGSRRICDR